MQKQKMGMTKAEEIVRKKYKRQGYFHLKNGFPDFIFYKVRDNQISDVRFVEVKTGRDMPTENQKKCAQILKSLNITYSLIRVTGLRQENLEKRKRGKKELLLKLLNKNEKFTASNLSKKIQSGIAHTKQYLGELEGKSEVIKKEEGKRTYWHSMSYHPTLNVNKVKEPTKNFLTPTPKLKECPQCGTNGIYTLKNKVRVCKKCGNRWKALVTK